MTEVATANVSLSKQQIPGKLAKKTSFLNEKVTFLHFDKENPMFGCIKPAGKFKIRKTAPANILKEKTVHNYHELFHGKYKKRSHPGKYQQINEI